MYGGITVSCHRHFLPGTSAEPTVIPLRSHCNTALSPVELSSVLNLLNVFPVRLPNFSLNLLLLFGWLQLLPVQSSYYYYYYHHHPHSSRHSSSAGSHNSAGPPDQTLPVHCYAKHLLAMQHACSLDNAVYSRAEIHRCYRTRPLSVAMFFLLALLSNTIPSRAYWCWHFVWTC